MVVYWKDSPNDFAVELIESLWFEGTFHIDSYGGDHEEWKAECDALIDEVNATEVRPVIHAHWRLVSLNLWDCTNCHYVVDRWDRKTPYCPDCGAKMDALK